MATVSVIIPVYNVSPYLVACLDSVCAQTLTDLEIILVDDGSADGSEKICDRYADRDERIRVIHKPNGGLSSARNTGIEAATSDWIGFIDSDDRIDPDMYELLYQDAQETGADLACCGIYDCYKGRDPVRVSNPKRVVMTSEQAVQAVMEAKVATASAVTKLYRRELFEEVRYPVGKTSEDAFAIIKLLIRCRQVSVNTTQRYYYIHRAGSITSSSFNHRDLDTIEAWDQNFELVKERFPALIDTAQMRRCLARFYILDELCKIDRPSDEDLQIRNQIVDFLRDNKHFILDNPNFNATRKWAMRALAISYRLYRLIVRLTAHRYY